MQNIKIFESKMLKEAKRQKQIQQLIEFSSREKLRDILVSQFLTTAEQFFELSQFIDEMQQIKCATSKIRMVVWSNQNQKVHASW